MRSTRGSVREHFLMALLVASLHAAGLWWAATHMARRAPRQEATAPPALVGMLVSEPIMEPEPLPIVPPPPPEPPPPPPPEPPPPKPKPKPRPPPPPPAPPSERAVTAPPAEPEPPPQETSDAPPVENPPPRPPAPPPVAAAPPGPPTPAPVTPPRREDAAHRGNPLTYPAESRRRREQGRVILEVYIWTDGSVREVRLKESSGHRRLDQAALTQVKRWSYVPARRGKEPIPYWYIQPVNFVLK